MGILADFINGAMSFAMEATEDITGDVENQMNTINGNSNGGGDSESIDLKTDGIFDEENMNGGSTPNDENTNNTEDSGTDGEDVGDNPDDSENPEDEGDSDQFDQDVGGEEESSNETPFEILKKREMHKKFLQLYQSLSSNIKLVSDYIPNISNPDQIVTINVVVENLTKCKDYVYNILTIEYPNTDYPNLQKKYVSLNHIYDICIKMMEKDCEIRIKENEQTEKGKKKSSKPKKKKKD